MDGYTVRLPRGAARPPVEPLRGPFKMALRPASNAARFHTGLTVYQHTEAAG